MCENIKQSIAFASQEKKLPWPYRITQSKTEGLVRTTI